MNKITKRYRDVRILVTKDVGKEYNLYWRIANKGDILDGWVDKKGNFRRGKITIYPSHFKILGKFLFKKVTRK
jgi:hypothetical protein